MVAKTKLLCGALFLGLSLFNPLYAAADADTKNAFTKNNENAGFEAISWQQMNDEQRRELIKRFQDIKKLPDQERSDLQQRMDWFSQLPKQQQQKMREAWQNMSASEREHWKTKLRQATPGQRDDLRQKIIEKYD